jgi:hypothetical protein
MAQQVELQAVPDQGFRFISWSGDHFGENNQVTITMGRSKEIRASFQPENELIQNGSFEQNLSHWMFWADPSEAKAEITVDQQQCRVDIDKKAQYPWQIQLNYPLSLEDDVNFTLSFRAKAASERSINLAMVQNHDPYKSFWAQEIQLNDQWESYDFAIQINPGDPNLRLEFDMGNHRADVFIDDVSLIINE